MEMYSLHMRRKILRIKEKQSFVKIGKRFGMSPSTIYKWTKRIRAKITRNRESKKVDIEVLKEDVRKNPDLYQYERARKFKVSQSTMWRELKRIGVTYKKTQKHPKAEEKKRITFIKKMEQYKKDKIPIAYIDESGFADDMPRTHGYSTRGARC